MNKKNASSFIDLTLFKQGMASSDNQHWLMFGHVILFEKIMMIVGLDCDTSLDICRQVCKTWNANIMNMIYENPTKKWGPIIQRRIERTWQNLLPSDQQIYQAKLLGKQTQNQNIYYSYKYMYVYTFLESRGIITFDVFESLAQRVKRKITYPISLSVVNCAASLTHHGLLGSVVVMVLGNVDLTSASAEHLTSLVSSVTRRVCIKNVSGSGLVTVLDNVKSRELQISGQRLGREETLALVRALESRVEGLELGNGFSSRTQNPESSLELSREMTLDTITALMEYSGQGKCKRVACYGDAVTRHKDQLMTWASTRTWSVTFESFQYLKIERMQNSGNITI